MFKQALSSLAGTVISAGKNTASEYMPGNGKLGSAFEMVSQRGIDNLSQRSPILADVANTVLATFRAEIHKKNQIKQYANSDAAKGIRTSIAEKLNKPVEHKDVTAETVRILAKMNSLSEKNNSNNSDSAEKNDLFQKFSKDFEKFKEYLNPKKKNDTPAENKNSDTPVLILEKIDVNTSKTAHILADMATAKVPVGENKSGAPGQETTPSKSGVNVIDPLTGLPSIRTAIGSIGGTFLSKIFDDELLSKYATKIRSKLAPEENPVVASKSTKQKEPTIKTAVVKEKTSDVLKAVTQKISGVSDFNTPYSHNESFVSKVPQASKTPSKTADSQIKILDQLKKLNVKTTESTKFSKDLLGNFKNIGSTLAKIRPALAAGGRAAVGAVGSGISAGGTALAAAARPALAAALPALAVAGAGAAGYAVGTGVNSLINSGLSKMTGSETSLGSEIYDLINGDPLKESNKRYEDSLAKAVEARKQAKAEALTKAVDKKVETTAEISGKAAAPTIIQAPSNTTNVGTNSTTIIAQSPIRNQESTFEKVQTSNYWARGR